MGPAEAADPRAERTAVRLAQPRTLATPRAKRVGPAAWLLPLLALLLAGAVFTVDTFSPLNMAIAVLYVVVILLSTGFCGRRGVMLVAAGCAGLAVASYAIMHGINPTDTATARLLVSLSAIAITTVLVLRNEAAMAAIGEQARLLDLTHDSIFVRDLANVVTYWNRGAEELYGWAREEAVGRVAHELLRTVFPAPLAEIDAELLRAGRWEGELVHTRRDGSRITVASRWSLARDERGRPAAILETNNDIHERKRAETALRRSEAYLAEAQKISRTGSFGWDSETGELYWSEETFRLFACDPAEPPTRERILERVHELDRPLVAAAMAAAQAEARPLDLRHRLRLPDGTVRHVHVLADASRGADGTVQIVGAVMDVTAAHEAEEALAQAQIELTHATRVATLGELTASIAHEINQPLAAIVTNGEAGLRWLMREIPDLGEVRRSVERMIADGRRASEVVARLRALARKAAPAAQPVDLNDVIEDALALVQREIERAAVRLDRDLAADLPAVGGDRVQLQQVLINLVVNAVQAMAATSRRELVVSSAAEADEIVVRVVDSGAGIAPELADRLFAAFYTTKPDGMGMGLSICRSIIEAHGGRIRAAANDGRPGATFEFRLPIQREVTG